MPAWYDVCLYVAGAGKNDRQGASRKDRVMAATGKDRNQAKDHAARLGNAGDVIKSNRHVATGFSPDTNLTRHLSEIYRLTLRKLLYK